MAPRFRTVFPAGDALAPFVVAVAIAGNDIEHALRQAVRANEDDRPEFTYWVRVANGFTFEGVRALQAWRRDSEVKRFLDRLPVKGRKQLKKVSGVEQKMGPGALEEMRNQTFHYPRPEPNYNPDSADRLREILKAEAEAEVEMDQLADGSIRFTFADSMALGLAIGKHYPPDDPRFIPQANEAMEGSIAFANLAKDIVFAYFRARRVGVKRESV